MMTSTPLRKACSCGPMPTPPKTAAPVIGVWTARSLRSSRICAASSRVGVSTSARVVPRGLADQPVEDRQQERGGLAAAGHRAGEQVAALERRRNGVGLDRRRRGKPRSLRPRSRSGWSLKWLNGIGPLWQVRLTLPFARGLRKIMCARRSSAAHPNTS